MDFYTMEKVFKMRTLNNNRIAFQFLTELQVNILNCKADRIILDFQSCTFTHAVFSSYIGALAEICRKNNKRIVFRFLSSESKVFKYFKRSGLYDYISKGTILHTNENAVPFWKVDMDDEDLMPYIDKIIDLSKISIEEIARQELFRNFYEIFTNAKEHSNERFGVYACGHWMPQKKCLVFSLYDTGIGIPQLVKDKVDSTMSDEEALIWALKTGHSTKQLESGVPRGVGLSDLKKFVRLNRGRLSILSNGIFYDYQGKQKEYVGKLVNRNIGTMVCVTIDQDDEHIYISDN